LSVSSGATDSGAESDTRERENTKKGKKSSVFGNLFRKRSRKPSKDEDVNRDDDVVETKEVSVRGVTEEEDEGTVNLRSRLLETSNMQNVDKGKPRDVDAHLHGTNYNSKAVVHTPVSAPNSRYNERKLQSLSWNPNRRILPRRRRKLAAIFLHLRFRGQMLLFTPSWTTTRASGMPSF